jgi:hypothetical protein
VAGEPRQDRQRDATVGESPGSVNGGKVVHPAGGAGSVIGGRPKKLIGHPQGGWFDAGDWPFVTSHGDVLDDAERDSMYCHRYRRGLTRHFAILA